MDFVRLDSLEAYKHALGKILLFRALLVISVNFKYVISDEYI